LLLETFVFAGAFIIASSLAKSIGEEEIAKVLEMGGIVVVGYYAVRLTFNIIKSIKGGLI
jgi:hypothetical protein